MGTTERERDLERVIEAARECADKIVGHRERDAVRIRQAAARLEGEEVVRYEGVAFLDGDYFCAGEDGTSICEDSASWCFVPNCEHDEPLYDAENRPATLLVRRREGDERRK